MSLRTKTLSLGLLLALTAFTFSGCGDKSGEETTTVSGETTVSSAPSSTTTTTSEQHLGADATFKAIGEVAKVEQGELSVSKITVTDNLTSEAANALLYTGEPGETENVAKAPAAGNEFLLVTFKYKKAEYYDFRGGLFPPDVILKNADGTEYLPVETAGYGGIFDSNAGKIKLGVEAFTTAVFEVPKGETGLVLVYHQTYEDGFSVNIR